MVELFLVGVAWIFAVGYVSYLLNRRDDMLDDFIKFLKTKNSLIRQQKNGSTALPHAEYLKNLMDLEAKLDALRGVRAVQNLNKGSETELGLQKDPAGKVPPNP